jgi:exoribonuclease R
MLICTACMTGGQHKVMSEITAGLHNGRFHQGKLRVNRYNPFEAYVGSESVGSEILIHGRQDMNRAFDGDVVAVELLPQSSWVGSDAGKIADRDGKEILIILQVPTMLPESSSWRMERLQQVGPLDELLASSNGTGASKILSSQCQSSGTYYAFEDPI